MRKPIAFEEHGKTPLSAWHIKVMHAEATVGGTIKSLAVHRVQTHSFEEFYRCLALAQAKINPSRPLNAGRVGSKDRKCAIDIIRWSLAYVYVAKHSLRTNKVQVTPLCACLLRSGPFAHLTYRSR